MQPQRCWLHGATATEGLALVLDKMPETLPWSLTCRGGGRC